MSNPIHSSVGATAPTAPVRPAPGARDNRADAATAHSRREDSVVLTGEARTLQQLEQQVRGADGVDAAKVAAIKRELAEGRYEVNAQAIAVRLRQSDEIFIRK